MKEESAHVFDDEYGCVRWEHQFRSSGINFQRPLKKNPYEVQLAVFESEPGCAESRKIGQVILNMAAYATKLTEQKIVLPISGGFSSGELSVTLKLQIPSSSEIQNTNNAAEPSEFFAWTKTKQLLSSLKRAYTLGTENEGDTNDQEATADPQLDVPGKEEEEEEEEAAGEEIENVSFSKKESKDKGHKRKPSRSLFARMLQDNSDNSAGNAGVMDTADQATSQQIVEEEEGARNGETTNSSAENNGQAIPGRKRTKSGLALIPNSPGQLEALELVRKFQEGRDPMKNAEKLEGLWERIRIHDLPVEICFANIDQCSEGVDGHAACSTLAVAIASWMKNSPSLVPDKEGELDQLIREGSRVWREIFEDESNEISKRFPDMHLDLETAAQAWAQKRSQTTCIDASKSFIGFLMPMDMSLSKWLKDATEGFLTFDQILEQAMQTQNQDVYVVAWNDHFFVIRICSPELIYLVDTLGVRLYDGCSKAFIVRFETDSETDSETSTESGSVLGKDNPLDSGEGAPNSAEQNQVAHTAKDKCKTFFRNVLARSTLDEVVSNLSALQLNGAEKTGEEKDKQSDSDKAAARDESTPNPPRSTEGEAGYEWQFLLEKIQVELQFIA